MLNTFNCDVEVLYGFMDSSPNYNITQSNYFADVHSTDPTIMSVIAESCQNAAAHNSTGIWTKEFLKIVQAATNGCKLAAIDEWFSFVGLRDMVVDKTQLFDGAVWIIDMIRFPEQIIEVESLKDLVITEMLENNEHMAVGRALAGAKRNGCANSWFLPPVDKMLSTVYKIQADFLLEDNTNGQDACAYKEEFYFSREEICKQVLAKMLDGKIAGDQLLGCVTDCEQLSGPKGGGLVSVLVSVQDVSVVDADGALAPPTKSQAHDFAEVIMKGGGMNITKSSTDDRIVAQAFAGTARPLLTYDLMHHAVWSDVQVFAASDDLADVVSKISWADLAPDMKAAAARFPGYPNPTYTTKTTTTKSTKPTPPTPPRTTTVTTNTPQPSQNSMSSVETALIGAGAAGVLIAIFWYVWKKGKASGSQESAGNGKSFSRLQDGSYEGDEEVPRDQGVGEAANTKRTSSWA
jgi:hypothetical protein